MASERVLKYFITQSLSGVLILMGLLNPSLSILLFLALILKLGLFPCYYWVVAVYKGLDWPLLILARTGQKLPSLVVVSCLTRIYSSLFLRAGLLTVALGRRLALGVLGLKKALAWRRVAHRGWIISLIACGSPWLCYLLVYRLLLTLPVVSLSSRGASSLLQSSFSSLISFISLAGVPPMAGFSLKWWALALAAYSSGRLALGLILVSLVSVSWYLWLGLNRALEVAYQPFRGPACVIVVHTVPLAVWLALYRVLTLP